MKILQLNHVALHVTDVPRSVAFYTDVLGLETIPRPDFKFPGAWFRLGEDAELHLIAREPTDGQPAREGHYALLVADTAPWADRLREKGVEFRGPNPRPDGAMQIFLRDPDQNVIELCSPPT